MTNLETDIYNSVVHNASLFLKEGVSILFRDKDFHKSSLDNDTFVLAVSNIQMAMELASKAFLIYHKGLKSIIHNSQAGKSMEELEQLFQNKRLKVQDFETVSKQLNGIEMNLNLSKAQRKNIEEFQSYRNKLFHLACKICDAELEKMRDSLLLYSINTVMYLLFDKYNNKRPSEFMAQLTHWDYFNTLQQSKVYRECMRNIAKESGDTILLCPICDDYTYSKEEEYCYNCDFIGIHIKRTNCEECGGIRTVIYDTGAHFIGHNNLYQGFCQECEAKNAIFECPHCGNAYHNYFDNGKPQCTEDHCIYE